MALHARPSSPRPYLYGLAGQLRPAVGDEPGATQTPSRATPASTEGLPLLTTPADLTVTRDRIGEIGHRENMMTNQPASNDSSRAGSARKTGRRPRPRRCPACRSGAVRTGPSRCGDPWPGSGRACRQIRVRTSSSQVRGHSLPLRASPGTAGLTHDHSRGALPGGLALI